MFHLSITFYKQRMVFIVWVHLKINSTDIIQLSTKYDNFMNTHSYLPMLYCLFITIVNA